MDMVDGYGDGGNPVIDKSEFVLSLFEQLDPRGIGSREKSIIDRCVDAVYRDFKNGAQIPTLCTLREKLLEQPEEEARELALSLELFTSGSLNAFAHETNVDTQSRIIVYDIHDLGRQLKTMGLLVITDAMLNRVTENWRKGRRTHVIVDEFHVVFENEHSAEFFSSAWRRFRKRNAYPTAITQNVASTGRDIGLQLYGGFLQRDGYSIINYNLAILNGSGINRKDDDKSKELVARLIFKPIKGLSVGGAYMAILGKDRIFNETRIANSPRWAVTAIYDLNQYVARAEFAQADFAGNTTNAFYAMFGYRFTEQWSLAGRYEFVNDELKVLDEDRITAGVAYKPFNFLRLQGDLSYVINHRSQNSFGCNILVTAMF